jgi:hypothetical protein
MLEPDIASLLFSSLVKYVKHIQAKAAKRNCLQSRDDDERVDVPDDMHPQVMHVGARSLLLCPEKKKQMCTYYIRCAYISVRASMTLYVVGRRTHL